MTILGPHLPSSKVVADLSLSVAQAMINQDFNQYKVKVDVPDYGPQVLHFAHNPSSSPNAIPLLFLQGWPGSFLEARKIIKPLTTPSTPDTQAFHVIVPSNPGIGPGDAPKKSGFGPVKTAKAFKILIVDILGYDKFVIQGGDWGAFIARSLAMQYPQHVKAYHCNLIPCGPPPWYKAPLTMGKLIFNSYFYTKREKQGLENMQTYFDQHSGYFKQQTTRPQSLGFGLGDSPIGLLGWFVDKYHEWVDIANYTMSDDETLIFVMMHWMQGATPGISYYKSAFQESDPTGFHKAFTTYLATPLGFSSFPKEVAIPPLDWMRAVANVQFYKEHEAGGHFASVECPDVLVADLREWFGGEVVKRALEA